MKREILFRGYGISSNEWVEGDLIHGVGAKSGNIYILPNKVNLAYVKNCDPLDGVQVHPDSVGQFTGMCDMDGDKVFEGDIVESISNGSKFDKIEHKVPIGVPHYVIYHEGAFKITKSSKNKRFHLTGLLVRAFNIKITGNTFKPNDHGNNILLPTPI